MSHFSSCCQLECFKVVASHHQKLERNNFCFPKTSAACGDPRQRLSSCNTSLAIGVELDALEPRMAILSWPVPREVDSVM